MTQDRFDGLLDSVIEHVAQAEQPSLMQLSYSQREPDLGDISMIVFKGNIGVATMLASYWSQATEEFNQAKKAYEEEELLQLNEENKRRF